MDTVARMRTVPGPGKLLAAVALALSLAAGCALPMSPADLARYENRPFPGGPRRRYFRGPVTAVKAMGFEVVASDPETGRIKTGRG